MNIEPRTDQRRTLIIRADASPQIGTGHLMRCLALAQTWQDAGGNAIFAMAMEAPALEARLKSEGMEVAHLPAQPGSADDAAQTANLARQMKASWVVVDGYHFGADYQRMIKDSGLRLLATDDNGHADHYYADIVLNQNLHAHEGLYANREPYTRLLLGPQYVLLRREFCKWRGWKRESPEVARRVLVTLGGSDPDNVTGKVIQALPHVKVEGLEAVVVGASNPHYQKLQSVAQDSRIPIRLASHATNMPELMARADAAIAGGGCTSWELAFMGLPGVILTLADNQRPVAEGLKAAGVAVSLGKGTNLTPTKITQVLAQLLVAARVRAEMARRGQALVDGEGANRALSWMQEAEEDGRRLTADRCQSTGGLRSAVCGPPTGEVRLRQVREDDCRLLWEWANDPRVRAVSFSLEPILWTQHLQWFRSKLGDPRCIFYIATNNGDMPMGQVRYDLEGDEALVSVSLDRKFCGQGYGSTLIRLSAQKVFDAAAITTIHAYVKQGNEASVRAFEKAGYRSAGTTVMGGQQALHLTLSREELKVKS